MFRFYEIGTCSKFVDRRVSLPARKDPSNFWRILTRRNQASLSMSRPFMVGGVSRLVGPAGLPCGPPALPTRRHAPAIFHGRGIILFERPQPAARIHTEVPCCTYARTNSEGLLWQRR